MGRGQGRSTGLQLVRESGTDRIVWTVLERWRIKLNLKMLKAAISSHTVMIASWTAQWSFQAD
jgi:hypothetical protein